MNLRKDGYYVSMRTCNFCGSNNIKLTSKEVSGNFIKSAKTLCIDCNKTDEWFSYSDNFLKSIEEFGVIKAKLINPM